MVPSKICSSCNVPFNAICHSSLSFYDALPCCRFQRCLTPPLQEDQGPTKMNINALWRQSIADLNKYYRNAFKLINVYLNKEIVPGLWILITTGDVIRWVTSFKLRHHSRLKFHIILQCRKVKSLKRVRILLTQYMWRLL